MPELATKYRTHTCGELRPQHLPKPPEPGSKKKEEPPLVLLCGHVSERLDARTLMLRDRYGSTLITVAPNAYPYVAERFEKVTLEDAIQVGGQVAHSPMRNADNPTGDVCLEVTQIEVKGPSTGAPKGLMTDAKVPFEKRLAARDFYLRRPEVQERLAFRTRVTHQAREFFAQNGFTEIETPHLFWYDAVAGGGEVVPHGNGRAWRTPSGPVVLDQYLLAGQFERFFQFTRITRREDPKDFTEWHQQEHTGLDVNMSYVDMPDFCAVVERLIAHVYKACLGAEIKTPFPAVAYGDAMLKFGTEKPDVRFELTIADLPAAAKKAGGGFARAFRAPSGAKLEDKVLEPLLERVKGAATLSWVRIDNLKKLTGPATALFTDPLYHDSSKLRETLLGQIGAGPGDLVVIATAPRELDAAGGAGRARVEVAKLLGLGKGVHQPVWVHSYPFLEEVPGKPLQPRVIVFATALDEDFDKLEDPTRRGEVRASTFDLVLNGEEIASGYIGNHSLETQHMIWERLFGIGRQDLYRLRAPIESHRFGIPPHGGMNLGFDRLVALMLGLDAIDEAMHFPKDAACKDPLLGAPAKVDVEAFADLTAEVKPPAEMTLEKMNQEVLTS